MSSSFNLNGNVGILIQPTSLYALDVNGDIHCNRVFAQNTSFTGPTGPQGLPGTTSGILYYLNKGVTGSATGYFQMSPNAVIGPQMYTGTVVLPTSGSTGVISEFITDINVPNVLFIPAGIWNATCFLSALAAGGGAPLTDAQCYIQLFQYSSTGSQTFIGQSSVQPVTTTSASPYQLAIQVNQTVLSLSDRLILKLIGQNASSPTKSITITGYFQDSTYSSVVTSLTLPVSPGPTGPIGPAGGQSGQLLFNQSGSATGTNSLVYNSTTNVLSVPTIYSSGQVGIGISNPDVTLHTETIGDSAISAKFMASGILTTNEIRVGRDATYYGNLIYDYGNATYGDCLKIGSAGLSTVVVNSAGQTYFPSVSSAGTLSTDGNGLLQNASDIRAKNTIQYVSYSGSLDKIVSLKPATFKYNSDPYNERIGFIAQDIETIIPQSVDGKKYEYQLKRDTRGNILFKEDGTPELDITKPRYRGLDYGAIIATLVNAIKEQQSIIDKQGDIMSNLRSRIEAIEQTLNRN